MKQDEPEAKEIALAIELFTHGSLNTFAKPTNVDTDNRLICYDILDLGKQLILKVSRTTVYELLKSKKFHSVRVGGQYRISKKSFENWLNGEKGGSEDGIC